MINAIENCFTTIQNTTTHYKKAGSGNVLVLLHPSPRNSNLFLPLMQQLQNNFLVIAPDLPGYGLSEPLKESIKDIYSYVPFLKEFIQSFKSNKVLLYGTATGAQLAIALGIMHPNLCHHIFLDNIAHFTEEERAEILDNYFIDISAKSDGSHLQALWQHVCDSCLYFPWYKKQSANKIADSLPSLPILQTLVTDYLQAGTNYAQAYKAAFNNERIEIVTKLTTPTTIFEWQASPLLTYMQRITQTVLSNNFKVVKTESNISERYKTMFQNFLLHN